MTSFSHDDYLCEDCHFPVDGYGLCLLYEAWKDTGMDNAMNENPCTEIKKYRERLIAAGETTEHEFIEKGNQLIQDLKAMEG